MKIDNKKIKEFTDLIAWQEGYKLSILIYRITKKFPKDELYGLVSQMRRAVVSITSNIAEGFGRQHKREKTNFYYMAQGSLTELKNQVIISNGIGYINKEDLDKLVEQTKQTHKLLQGLIKSTKKMKPS